ncbi:MAG: hypothetical protein HZB46_08595, partial [Solirubrobacterales bacterium]|nr:hypothetical protein [Solirubrobacterales bacterium]
APAGQPAFRTVGVGLRTALRRGLPLRVTCPQSCDASATARIGAGTARRNRLGRRAMVVGRGRLDAVEAGRTATLTVRFTERARRRLRRARRVELAVTVAFATADGTATQARRVALNR